MLFLLAIPAFAFVGSLQAALQAWTPSNVLIRRVKAAPPRWRTAAGLLALAAALLLAMRALELAIAAGAPTWLYFPVGILAWDVFKIATLAILQTLRCATLVLHSARRSAIQGQHDPARLRHTHTRQLCQDGTHQR